ncbi:hypothetical protein AVEN_149543-1 [Araneus ventricosus]|uniref:Uncharacterized protein n=1 Tax=Araneus ventricosus TaxID=182803 RepID=A0A4Y2P6P9_ARAVE|nr:hypothetical protein AVEN_149543-1 [Araneus ventricosus]
MKFIQLQYPPTPPAAFKTGPPLRFLHLPHSLQFVVFAFVRELRSPSLRSYFSFMTQRTKWNTNEIRFPNFCLYYADSHRNFALMKSFGAKRFKWLGAVTS